MNDKIFYPDRTPAEAARLHREAAQFFKATIKSKKSNRKK